MKKHAEALKDIKLVGLSTRTNNTDEMNPDLSKIAQMAGNFWGNQLGNKIKHRANPGVTYSVYTDYDSDEHGEYTYFIGEEVESFADQDMSQFQTLTIPESHYMKFTTNPGPMPEVVIQAWQEIWQIDANDFSAERAYIADFEVYDQRAKDPSNAVLDIYIGIK